MPALPHHPLPLLVGTHLQQKGLDLATHNGKFQPVPFIGRCIGIIREVEPPKKYFFGLLKSAPKKELVARLWLRSRSQSADPKNWVLEIQKDQHAVFLKNLAQELSATFKVQVTVNFIPRSPAAAHELGSLLNFG